MTHNIIHDEEKIKELCASIAFENYCVEYIMQQYAEHYLIKHIDSEIERLENSWKVYGRYFRDPNNLDNQNVDSYNQAIIDQITHLQSLKAELTKSK